MINFFKYHNSVLDRDEIRLDIAQLYYWGIETGYDYDSVLHIIVKIPYLALWYAECVIDDRWIEAEPYIKESPHHAYRYAKLVVKGRWIEAEPHIKQNKWYWDKYSKWLAND